VSAVANRAPKRATARAAVVPLRARRKLDLARFAPSARSLLVAFGVLGLAVGSYAVARETSLFALERIEVVGAPQPISRHVQKALRPLRGESLVVFRGSALQARIAALPDVASAHYDRAFPHTLRVFVVPEEPLAVVRRSAESWLVSARGRVIAPLERGDRPALPRIWVPATVELRLGRTLSDTSALLATRALRLREARRLPVRSAVVEQGEITFLLRGGLELRLGREQGLPLRLAVAARILPQLLSFTGAQYLDVRVPERPVSGPNSQLKP
jgi:cell division septal protein FtsQ